MAKDTLTKTVIYVIMAGLVVLTWGIAFGGIREKVKSNTVSGQLVKTMVDSNKETISAIKEEQAYQKGVVNTKLDTLTVGQKAIMKIIQEWEPK